MGVIVAWLVCGVGWVGVYLIPNQFESSARLFVDADAILTPLLRGLAAETAPTTELEILQRTLLSRPNMEKLISKTDLDLTINSPADRERLISRLADTIRVVPQTKNLFTITYRDKNPKMAHDVVQTLIWTTPGTSWSTRSRHTSSNCVPPRSGGPISALVISTSCRTPPHPGCPRWRPRATP
jgi:hypothetical protein